MRGATLEGNRRSPVLGGSQVMADSVQQQLRGYEIILLALISGPWPGGQEDVSKERA